jgi:N-methylhydantoinase A/oxoprolinase/acetone carboxylase beta subunit
MTLRYKLALLGRLPSAHGVATSCRRPRNLGAEPGPGVLWPRWRRADRHRSHLILGHLPPYLLGVLPRSTLKPVRRAIATRIAGPMGLALDDVARGILAIADNHMTGSIRVVSVERGTRAILYSSRSAAPARCMAAHRPRLLGIENSSGAARFAGHLGARAPPSRT